MPNLTAAISAARRLAALLIMGALAALLGACAPTGQTAPGGALRSGAGAMPGADPGLSPIPGPGRMMGGPGMRGYGPGMRGGYGPRMRGYGPMRGPGMGPGMAPGMRGGGMAGGAMRRHRQAMMDGIPSDYAGARNPLPPTREVTAAGERLYQANCAVCHGSGGDGDGPGGAGLSPPPANLRWTVRRPVATDGYLMWAISDGGAAIGTGMPAFAGALSEQDRWRIVHHLRTL